MTADRPWWRSYLVLGALGAAVAACAVELVMSRLSGAPPELVLFFGRFHPLAVHLPIGIFLLAAAAELTSFWPSLRARVEPALELVLAAMVVSAFGAFVLGQMLASGGGFPGESLLLHRRLTLVSVIGAALCLGAWVYRQKSGGPRALLGYRVLLVGTLGVLSLGAHFGGTMTRGDTYFSKYAPSLLKPLFGGSSEPKAPRDPPKVEARAEPLLFSDVIKPIFKRYCVECHGDEEEKGGLRLDSLEAIMKGGDSGEAVTAGAGEDSLAIERMLLPLDDDDHMPPEDREGPKPEEIEIIKFWIDRGLGDSLKVRDLLAPTAARALLEKIAAETQNKQPANKQPANKQPTNKQTRSQPEPSAAEPRASSADAPASKPDVPPGASPGGDETAATNALAADDHAPSNGAPSRLDPFAILSSKCQKCHGPKKQKAKLRVDSLGALRAGGKNGPAIVPGDADASLLIDAIRRPLAAKGHMPPKKEEQLSAGEIAALVGWVRNGTGGGATARVAAAEPASTSALAEQSSGATPASDVDGFAEATEDASTSSQPEEPGEPSSTTGAGPAVTADETADADLLDPMLVDALPEQVALFQDFVKPALDKRCGGCHNGKDPSGGLDMASAASLRSGGDSGPVIVPGDASASLLVGRVLLPVADSDHMPPDGLPDLSPGEIALVRAWIDRGATLDATARTRELAPSAQRLVAERASKAPPETAPPPVAAAGGCAACSIGVETDKIPGVALSLAVALALALRRRRRSGPAAGKTSGSDQARSSQRAMGSG